MNHELKIRMLLRVSSRQQLDADGDLGTQRRIVEGYINRQKNWKLDGKKPEYHELGVSGYKNAVDDREVLQEILADAKRHEFHILVCYKDDRLGRREDEIPAYIKRLADNGVLVYTVKEGCITPQNHTDNLMTFIRYWSAQGDSMKTAQRVKDSAIEQVRMGKNQGGRAPFGYRLELSGELSKHQRALKKKVIVPEEAALVKKIFEYSLTYGYGAYKIAKALNSNPEYSKMARNGVWSAGTINDMLKNPIYTGYEAYNRRTHEGKTFRRLNREEWVLAEKCNEEIRIIDRAVWEKVQRLREDRKDYYQGKREQQGRPSISTTGKLPLLDVAYCGYCGRKLTNGSRYNYWTTKDGERRSSIVAYYRCQTRQQGGNCKGKSVFRADSVEPEVYAFVRAYLAKIEDNKALGEKIRKMRQDEAACIKKKIRNLDKQQKECEKRKSAYEETLPKILCGEISIPVEECYKLIEGEKDRYARLQKEIDKLQLYLKGRREDAIGQKMQMQDIPAWGEVFDGAEPSLKRMIINKLIERIDIWEDGIRIRTRINVDGLLSRIIDGFPTTPYKHGSK